MNLNLTRIQLKTAKYHEFVLNPRNPTFGQPKGQGQRKVLRTINLEDRRKATHASA